MENLERIETIENLEKIEIWEILKEVLINYKPRKIENTYFGYGMCPLLDDIINKNECTFQQYVYAVDFIEQYRLMKGIESGYLFDKLDKQARINWIDEQIKLLQ